jgi:hypothetical protein
MASSVEAFFTWLSDASSVAGTPPEGTEAGQEGEGTWASGTSEASGAGEPRPYDLMEAMPLVYVVILIFVVLSFVVVAVRLADLWAPEERPLRDISDSGTFDLDGATVEPYVPFGAHARAINLTLLAGDRLHLEFTVAGPPDGVEALLQRPISPTNASTSPAKVLESATGLAGSINFTALEPGAYQVYFFHPAAVRPPPPGVDTGDWHVDARVTYSLRIQRAGD